MRYLSVSSSGTFSVSAGACGELHGFTTQLLENSRGHLRARQVTFGGANVVILRVGELDDALQRSPSPPRHPPPSPFSPQHHTHAFGAEETDGNDSPRGERKPKHETHAFSAAADRLFVTIGSDDGYGATTLLRLAALVSELCLFLHIDPKRGGPNAPLLRQCLTYMEARLAARDVSLLAQMAESLAQPAIVATGYQNEAAGLMDELTADAFASCPIGEKGTNGSFFAPNYAAVLLGHKWVLQTTPHWSAKAARMAEVGAIALHHSDRYLAGLITAAVFATPNVRSCHDITREERDMRRWEGILRRFGITRHNCTRQAAKAAVWRYANAMRNDAPNETPRARHFAMTLAALQWRMRKAAQSASVGVYHAPEMDVSAMAERTWRVDGICFRNAAFVGSMRLHWIHAVSSADETHTHTNPNTPKDHRTEDGEDGEDEALFDVCPKGYGLCLLYLPPRSAREYDRWQSAASANASRNDAAVLRLARDVCGAMETSFNRVQWLLSPPVESYEVPGLVHFVIVDRRRNDGVAASFARMAQQRPPNVRAAVDALRRLVALNMSRAHDLLQEGYTEGLWGHFGMQFFFCVVALPGQASPLPPSAHTNATALTAASDLSGRRRLFGPFSAREGSAQRSQTMSPSAGEGIGGEGLFGGMRLPAGVGPHMALRPMLIPDMLDDGAEETRVMEVYAVFLGAMSPAEVCREVEKLLHSRLLPFA